MKPRRYDVDVAPAPDLHDAGLGRLDEALSQLAACQGSWPPDLDGPVLSPRRAGSQDGPDSGPDGGAAEADRCVDAGARLLVLGGEDTPGALAVCAALLDLEPLAALGTDVAPGSVGGWSAALVGVREGLAAGRAHVGHPEVLAARCGDAATGWAAGVLAAAAERRVPVLLDGSAQSCAALLLADRLAFGVTGWCLVGTRPVTPGARAALEELHVEPLLDLGLSRAGAPLAAALLRAALEVHSP